MIIWDLELAKKLLDDGNIMIGSNCLIHELHQHVGLVQSVSFSASNEYLATLGGQDDNALVIWRVETGIPVCGFPAGPDSGLVCKWLNGKNNRLVTAGYYHIRVWEVDFIAPKLHPVDVKVGSLRRVISSIDITPDDSCAYCGTTTGDVIRVKIDRDEINHINDPNSITPLVLGVSKDKLSLGVNALKCVVNPSSGNYNIVIGGGDGTLTYMNPTLGLVKKNTNVLKGGITSICDHPITGKLTVGTNQSNRYDVTRDLLEAELKGSCHYGPVNDVTFPEGCPDLVVTSSTGDIRVWNINKKQELLRIQVPNLDCLCAVVSKAGSTILSGWDDGKVRGFLPESGKLKFTINDAHDKVTSLACIDKDDAGSVWRIISGGSEGKVRIWNISPTHQILVASLKEHRGAINCLKVSKDYTRCISASSDGSSIIWDLGRYVRLQALFENNVFRSVIIHPDESQYMTCGTNHKLTYWDAVDGQAIRVIDGGDGTVTSLDIDPLGGEYVVSGCEDKLLKVWSYDDGEVSIHTIFKLCYILVFI